MFKTVKSKVLILTLIMMAVLMSAFICYIVLFKTKTQDLMFLNYKYSLGQFVQEIEKDVTQLEDNSRDLALIGSLFYKTDRSTDLTDKVVLKIFENYPRSLGGGIWFEPYAVDKSQKRFCFYAFRDKNNNLKLDRSFNSDEYNYHNQGWYKQIKSQVTKKHDTAWSLPYYENQGSKTMMVTVGTGIFEGDKLIGISTVDWDINTITKQISEMKPIESRFKYYNHGDKVDVIKDSFALFAINDYIISSTDPYLENEKLFTKPISNIPWFDKKLAKEFFMEYHGKTYVPYFKYISNGMTLVICIPKIEMFKEIINYTIPMVAILVLLGFAIPLLSYFELKRDFLIPIEKLIKIAGKISKGREIEIKIDRPEEFANLASTYNKMTKDIKSIAKEREKINSELSIAKSIQISSLPNVFPPFPDNKEFSIFATMEPAKDVGGDFYDFYFTDRKDNFMFLVADVSGKGIPAALFMMTAKTLIKNMAQVGYNPKEMIKIINNKICENNQQNFFITMLAGIVNIKNGKLTIINCGHNKPLIKHNDGNYEYIDSEANIPLGVFENFEFKIHEINLQPGDIIFAYTDGITEANNKNDEMYGYERLHDILNKITDTDNVKNIAEKVREDIKEYTQGATQSDDITMLCYKYQGENNSTEKVFEDFAITENYKPFCNWLHETLNEWNVDKDIFSKIDMCSEEIFANITFYAYPPEKGRFKVTIDKSNDEIKMVFEDSGLAYNPLEKADPDITLPPEQRPLGGLGIYMVKNLTKNVTYSRENERNILTLIF